MQPAAPTGKVDLFKISPAVMMLWGICPKPNLNNGYIIAHTYIYTNNPFNITASRRAKWLCDYPGRGTRWKNQIGKRQYLLQISLL